MTNDDIADLAQAAQKIDDVVKLIQSVAGQTNLLALNATIEAARAGAAGKGFAVVASEVKALAVQTAKATDDIGSQIAAVQTSTQSAVRAIGNITARMQEIQQFTGAIATSVEQPNAATGEISDNVAAAASGTKSVVGVLQRVSGAIADMHKARRYGAGGVAGRRESRRQPPRQRRRLPSQGRSVVRDALAARFTGIEEVATNRRQWRVNPGPPQSCSDSTRDGLRLQAPRWCQGSGR